MNTPKRSFLNGDERLNMLLGRKGFYRTTVMGLLPLGYLRVLKVVDIIRSGFGTNEMGMIIFVHGHPITCIGNDADLSIINLIKLLLNPFFPYV